MSDGPPKVNVILEYRDQPGSEQCPIWLDEMDVRPFARPFYVQYGGRTFTQSRQRLDGLWVYAG